MKKLRVGSSVVLGTLVVAVVATSAAVAGGSDGRIWDGGAAYEQEQAIAKTLPDDGWEPLLNTVLDESGSIVVVLYATASDSDIAEAKRKYPHRVMVSHFTPESYERAENAAMSIAGRTARSAFGVYYEADTDSVRVEGDVDPVSAERIQATVPGDITVVIDTSPGGRYSRTSDTPPHRGGARITSVGSGNCTTGLAIKYAGVNRMVTAGHCFDVGDPIIYGGWGFGTITHKLSFSAYDLALISGSTYQGYIYTGGAAGVSTKIAGAGSMTLGSSYCGSGASSYSHCSHTVTNVSGTLCELLVCTPNLAVMTGGGNFTLGDSGGPMYIDSSNPNQVFARGIFLGAVGSKAYAHHWSTVTSQFPGATIL